MGGNSSTSTGITPLNPHSPQFNARAFLQENFNQNASQKVIRSLGIDATLQQLVKQQVEGGALLGNVLSM